MLVEGLTADGIHASSGASSAAQMSLFPTADLQVRPTTYPSARPSAVGFDTVCPTVPPSLCEAKAEAVDSLREEESVKSPRKILEIKVFFDDGTFQTFTP